MHAIQRDLDRMERWECANLRKFSKAECKAHLGWGSLPHRYRMSRKWIENCNGEKNLRMLVDEKLNMSEPCALAAQKPSVS